LYSIATLILQLYRHLRKNQMCFAIIRRFSANILQIDIKITGLIKPVIFKNSKV